MVQKKIFFNAKWHKKKKIIQENLRVFMVVRNVECGWKFAAMWNTNKEVNHLLLVVIAMFYKVKCAIVYTRKNSHEQSK